MTPRKLILPGDPAPDPNTHSNMPGPCPQITSESMRDGMRRMADHFRKQDPREALRPIGLDKEAIRNAPPETLRKLIVDLHGELE